MKVKVGDVEFQVTLVNTTKELKDLTIGDLEGAHVTLYVPTPNGLQPVKPTHPVPRHSPTEDQGDEDEGDEEEDALSAKPLETIPLSPNEKKLLTPINALSLLKQINFSSHTIVQTTYRVLGIRTAGDRLQQDFNIIKDATLEWPNKSLEDEEIWAIYVAAIHPPRVGKRIVAVGLNKAGQYIILGMSERSEKDLFENLKSRGLRAKDVKFGMLSFHLSAEKTLKTYFPKAQLARDWQEFIDMHDDEDIQEELKALMINPDKAQVAKELKDFNGPKELLTYYSFDSQLWRVLRTASCISKIDTDLRSNTKIDVPSPDHLKFLTLWALMRIQFQWLRIPVTGKQFANFRHIKPMIQALK